MVISRIGFPYNRFVEHQVQVVLRLLLLMVWKALCIQRYINQNLFKMLFVDNIHLVAKIKKNMKNSLMNLYDKLLLRKRSVIETVNDELKNVCQIEHTRHRSFDNFATNLIAGLIAYNLLPKKPEMNIEIIDKSRIIA